jgi:hypothetical protein
MTLAQLTTQPTEADLEARIDAAVRAAFPWLPPKSLQHQTKFAFRFGRPVVTIDGTQVSKAHARLADAKQRRSMPPTCRAPEPNGRRCI